MRTPPSPLRIDVRELLEHPGTVRRVAFDAHVPDLRSGLSEVTSDVHFELALSYIDGGVIVRGEMSGEVTAECRRCAGTISAPFAFSGSELYRPAGDVWEEGYAITDEAIDLEPMARDTVVLGLEESPLCRPDCAGLCRTCGADLNEGACGCPPAEDIDIRWSGLRDLGRNLGNGPASSSETG